MAICDIIIITITRKMHIGLQSSAPYLYFSRYNVNQKKEKIVVRGPLYFIYIMRDQQKHKYTRCILFFLLHCYWWLGQGVCLWKNEVMISQVLLALFCLSFVDQVLCVCRAAKRVIIIIVIMIIIIMSDNRSLCSFSSLSCDPKEKCTHV